MQITCRLGDKAQIGFRELDPYEDLTPGLFELEVRDGAGNTIKVRMNLEQIHQLGEAVQRGRRLEPVGS